MDGWLIKGTTRYSKPCPECGERETWYCVPVDLPDDAEIADYVDRRQFVPCRCNR